MHHRSVQDKRSFIWHLFEWTRYHAGINKIEEHRDPSEHGGVGPLAAAHTKAGCPHHCPLVVPLIDHQGTPTVTLTRGLHPSGAFECADHLKMEILKNPPKTENLC